MLTIKTHCLPILSQDELVKLHQKIVSAVATIPALGVKSEDDMLNLFPPDSMKYGLGTEILAEITDVKKDYALREELTSKIGNTLKESFPKAKVRCNIIEVDSDTSWSSES